MVVHSNSRESEKLARIIEEGNTALEALSLRLNEHKSILDCTNVFYLDSVEFAALFKNIDLSELQPDIADNFIDRFTDRDTLDNELDGRIREYIDREPDGRIREHIDRDIVPPPPPPPNGSHKLLWLILPLLLIAGTGVLVISNQKSDRSNKPLVTNPLKTNYKLVTNKLTIGILGKQERYNQLRSYLQQIFGNDIQISLDGSSSLDYQTAKDKIVRHEWDIVFSLSPMISIAAKDNGYTWAARMFPDKPSFYQSALFVRADSQIQSLADLKPTTVIALGDFNSASSFYMPSYTLYGKTLTVDRGHRGTEIRNMVKSGKADVGAAAFGDTIDSKSYEFRIINKSRYIPGSGVYLSPQLSESDRQIIKDVLLQAPETARDTPQANYGAGAEPDYLKFRQITSRVESILACVNWQQKAISFYCPSKDKAITGLIINALSLSTDSTKADLELQTSDRQTYHIILPLTLVNQVPGAGSLLNLKNKHVKLIDVMPNKVIKGKREINIDRASQIEIFP